MNLEKLKIIGEELKDARKSKGITLQALAKELKIKSAYIDAIEKGAEEALPSDVYIIGYVKQYSKFLNLDYKQYIDELQKEIKDVKISSCASKNLITDKEFYPHIRITAASIAVLIACYFAMHSL